MKNPKLHLKILDLIENARRTPNAGLGKPEALKGNLKGNWSRRINDEHRLVYYATDSQLSIVSCKGHYA